MTFKEISELLKLVTKSNLTEVKIKDGEFEIAIRTDKYSKSTTQVVSSQPQMVSMAAPAMPASFTTPAAAPAVEKPAEAPAPTGPSEIDLLTEIRDALKK